MKSNKEKIVEYMQVCAQLEAQHRITTFTTQDLAQQMNIGRQNVSTLLNQLVREGLLEKKNTRPVQYSLSSLPYTQKEEDSCFKQMIGHDGSLKDIVRLAKAVVLYPDQSLHTLILGPYGSGRTYFAQLISEFARESGIIAKDAPFIKCNCRYFAEHKEERDHLQGEKELFQQAQGGVLFFDNVDLLSEKASLSLLSYIQQRSQETNIPIVICATSDQMPKFLLGSCQMKFPVRIEIPPLSERSLEERFALIQRFFNEEVCKMRRNIKVNEEILRCVLLYRCEYNIKQLRNDIRISCANAYLRDFQKDGADLLLYLEDLPNYVQKGILYYRENRAAADAIIPTNCTYTFCGEGIKKETLSHYGEDSIYNIIDQKARRLRERGIPEESICTIVCADLESYIRQMTENVSLSRMGQEALSKIVKKRVIEMVSQFLQRASEKLRRVYSESTFYGLCLNINSVLERQRPPHMSNEQIQEITNSCQEEYALSQSFGKKLEEEFQIELSLDDILIITMFISDRDSSIRPTQRPVVLIAMHGDGSAAAMANVVNSLARCDNTYAFDMRLEQSMEDAYSELKETICRINQGKGVLLLYDMGSIAKMAGMISTETGIPIRVLEIPSTLIALDCSRKADCGVSLDETYDSVAETYLYRYQQISEEYRRQTEHRVIIALCMSGEGAAVQMKRHMEKYLALDDVSILTMAVSDRVRLLRDFNQLMQSHQILYIVGTYDPHLFGIPFVSITQLFETPPDKLGDLLSLDTAFIPEVADMSLESVIEYLAKELPGLDTKTLKRTLPKFLQQIKRAGHPLSPDQEVGLYMHMACAIARLQEGVRTAPNPRKKTIISHNKRLYNLLGELLAPLQMSFDISFNDDERANIISIIKQL